LRDAAANLTKSNGTIILVGPTLEIPEDAQKDVRLIDFPLPSREELNEQVELFITRMKGRVPIQLDGQRDELVRTLQGLTRTEADQVLAQAAVTYRVLDDRAIGFCLQAKAQVVRQFPATQYIADKWNYDDIGGVDLLKTWARRMERALTPEAAAFGVDPPRGVLIVGIQGCGKTALAKAIAGPNRPLIRLDVGAIFQGLMGSSESNMRAAWKVARAIAPCVLWIDEAEKLFGTSGGEMDGNTTGRVFGTFLTEMEESAGLGIFVVATANDISNLKPEFIRRFDEVFFVDLPEPEARKEILEIHLRKRGRDPEGFDLDTVIEVTDGFTGSELEKVVKAAILRAFDQGHEVHTEDLTAVIKETVPLSRTMAENIASMRKWADRARPASSRQTTGMKADQLTAAAFLEL
jgi:AAA+ superfamily predicted ATPase